jgi:hypothetical protein
LDAGASADYLEARSVPKYLRACAPHDDSEAGKIRRLAGARHAPADWIERAQIVALSWDGLAVPAIAAQVGCHANTVRRWLHRFNAAGIDGLGNRPGAGRKRRITEAQRSRLIALASHNSKDTRAWLEGHPRIQHAFIPKGACWLNLQESWWRIFRKTALAGQFFAGPTRSPTPPRSPPPAQRPRPALGLGTARAQTPLLPPTLYIHALRNVALASQRRAATPLHYIGVCGTVDLMRQTPG